MEILQDRDGDATIVAPAGRLDSASAETLRTALKNLDANGVRTLVVDLAGVDYISSAGLGVLLEIAKRMRAAGGAFAICALGIHVRRVFELGRCLQQFTVAATRDEAVARITSPDRTRDEPGGTGVSR